MRNRYLLACAASLALASCGGGDGSAPPTSGGGGPTPTPTSTGTPTPTASYKTFAELTGTQTFATTCGTLELGHTLVPGLATTQFGDTIKIVSNRTNLTYDITADPGAFAFGGYSTSFTSADKDPAAPSTVEAYAKVNATGFTDRFVTFAPPVNGTPLSYVKYGQIIASLERGGFSSSLCAYGVPTQLNDVPAAAVNYNQSRPYGSLSVTENVGAGPQSPYSLSDTTARVEADPKTGAIKVTVFLKGRLISNGTTSSTVTNFGTFTGTTAIDGTQQTYSDLLLDSGSAVSGTFSGWFFGPQGREAALSFSIVQRRADNSDVVAAGVIFLTP